MALAEAAAVALLLHIVESEAHEMYYDLYGPGVFYRAAASEAEAEAIAAHPTLEPTMTYSTGANIAMCGEMAVGVLRTQPRVPALVVDVIAPAASERSARCTVWVGGEPAVQMLVLKPAPDELLATFERLPEPVADDDETCARVTTTLRRLLATDEPGASDRRVYYMDARIDNVDEPENFDCIDESAFIAMMATLERLAEDSAIVQPRALRKLAELHASHAPAESVLAWLKLTADTEVVWLVPRVIAATVPTSDEL